MLVRVSMRAWLGPVLVLTAFSGTHAGTLPSYRLKPARQIPYGSGEEGVGRRAAEDHRVGPESFAVNHEGVLYVCDTVNNRVKILDFKTNKARHVSLPAGMGANDLAFDDEGRLYVFDEATDTLMQYDRLHELRAVIKLEPGLLKGRGGLHVVKDLVYMRTNDQVDVAIGEIVGGVLEVPSGQDVRVAAEGGVHGFSGRLYKTSLQRMRMGFVQVRSADGSSARTIEIPLPGILSIVFLGEDAEGNAFVQTECLVAGAVVLEVQKFDPKGLHIATVAMPSAEYDTWTARLVYVDRRGDIHQFVPQRTRAQFHTFSSF